MWTRILYSIILLFSVLYLPFYITFALMIAGMWLYSMYLEGVIFMLISDLVFGAPQVMYANVTMVSFFTGLLVLGIIETLKKSIKFYTKKA